MAGELRTRGELQDVDLELKGIVEGMNRTLDAVSRPQRMPRRAQKQSGLLAGRCNVCHREVNRTGTTPHFASLFDISLHIAVPPQTMRFQ